VAESDKIKAQDLIQDNVFDNTTKSAKALEQELSKLVIGFEGIIKANAEMLKLNKDPKAASQIKEVNAALIENEKLRKAVAVAERELIKNGSEQLKQDRELLRLSKERQKEEDKAFKQQQAQNSAYKQASDRLRDVKKEMKDLQIAGNGATEQFKKLNKEFLELDTKVRLADASVGDFQRNVGNYSGKFNGLGNSVNQLTREMPAFANSMQTGFMAISNNLPIFFDEITKAKNGLKEMQAEGQKTPSLFQTIASSIFTWGTALSIGVTLLTVFGKEIVNLIAGLFKADEAFKISAEKQSEYNKEFLDRANERIDAMLKIKQLTGELSQNDVDKFNATRTLRGREQKAIQDHYAILEQIRIKYKLTGNEFVGGVAEKRKLENDAIIAEQTRFRNTLIDIEKTAIYKRKELEAVESDRVRKEAEKTNKKEEKDTKEKIDKTFDLIEELNEKLSKGKQLKDTEYNDNIERAINEETELLNRYKKDLKEIQDLAEKMRIDKINHDQQLEQQTTAFLKQELDNRNKAQQQAIDNQIAADQKAIDRQFQLAKDGQENILAETEKRLAQDQLAKKDALEKERKQKEAIALAEAYFNAYNAELKQPKANPSSAAQKALGDVLLAKGIAKGIASFFEGTEDTGNGGKVDNKGGFVAVLHPNERVVTAEQNKKMKGLSNDELTDIAHKFKAGELIDVSKQYNLENRSSFAENLSQSILVQQNNEIAGLLKDIKNKPVQQVNVDGMMNLIETVYREGRKDVIIHKGKTRI
jgi:hypothetical protein